IANFRTSATSKRDLVARFFSRGSSTSAFYTLSLHDALPISTLSVPPFAFPTFCKTYLEKAHCRLPLFLSTRTCWPGRTSVKRVRSEEHTSVLQSPCNLVCRLQLEKKKRSSITCVKGSLRTLA